MQTSPRRLATVVTLSFIFIFSLSLTAQAHAATMSPNCARAKRQSAAVSAQASSSNPLLARVMSFSGFPRTRYRYPINIPGYPWPSSSTSSAPGSSSSSSTSSSVSSSSSSSSQSSTSTASVKTQVINLVNQERQKAGLNPLSNESHLETAAQKHAEDMANRNFFDHVNPDGLGPTERIRAAGYPMTSSWSTGENIAYGQPTAQDVMNSWMNSLKHKANILSTSFKEIGIGYYVKNGRPYWVQDFGRHQ